MTNATFVHEIGYTYTDTHLYFLGSYFSQWAKSPFKALDYNGNTYRDYGTAEQFMMAQKALLFGDEASLQKIMLTHSPMKQKAYGRKVAPFDADTWNAHARNIVFHGNWAKFTQNPEMKEFLLETGDRFIVEGAHYDPVWGVLIDYNDPKILDRANWQGTNWLGQCIMMVRKCLCDPNFVYSETIRFTDKEFDEVL